MVRHGVEAGAGRAAVALLGRGVLGPQAAVTGVALGNDTASGDVWCEEVEEDEDKVPEVEADGDRAVLNV